MTEELTAQIKRQDMINISLTIIGGPSHDTELGKKARDYLALLLDNAIKSLLEGGPNASKQLQ